MKLNVLASALAICVAGFSSADATYSSSSLFFSDLAITGLPSVLEGFESYDLNTTVGEGGFLGPLKYSNFAADTLGRVGNTYNRFGDKSLEATGPADFFDGNSGFTITFPNPVRAVGLFVNVQAGTTNFLSLSNGTNTALTGNGAYDTDTFYFAGIISDTPFSSVSLNSTNGPSGFNVDNITYAAVPEPASVTVLGLGMLAALRRRKKA